MQELEEKKTEFVRTRVEIEELSKANAELQTHSESRQKLLEMKSKQIKILQEQLDITRTQFKQTQQNIDASARIMHSSNFSKGSDNSEGNISNSSALAELLEQEKNRTATLELRLQTKQRTLSKKQKENLKLTHHVQKLRMELEQSQQFLSYVFEKFLKCWILGDFFRYF